MLSFGSASAFTGAVLTCDRGWVNFKQPDVLRGFHMTMAKSLLETEEES